MLMHGIVAYTRIYRESLQLAKHVQSHKDTEIYGILLCGDWCTATNGADRFHLRKLRSSRFASLVCPSATARATSMGVNGLSRYVKRCRLYKEVDIREMANSFRCSKVGKPVIAVDGSQCASYLYGKMNSLHGGQYKEFREKCERFVKLFQGMGFRLSFFFNGLPVEEKIPAWLKRRGRRGVEICKFFGKLRAAQAKGRGYIYCRHVPEGVIPCASVAFKETGCEVHLSTTDCDTELAQFAAGNECCVGVLSNDSDLLIYSGVPCILTFDSLQVGKTLTGWRFQSSEIASHLGIEVDDLPAFASFVGNDIVAKAALRVAYRNLRQMYGSKKVTHLVTELLKTAPRGDLRRICEIAFRDNWREGLELVQKGVCSYKYEKKLPATAQKVSRWDEVVQHVKGRHASCEIPRYVFTVVKSHIMRFCNVLEDLSASSKECPPTGLVVRAMLARMYTVLLCDSGAGPFHVTEYIPTGSNEILQETVEVEKRLPEGIHHPGLLELWSGPEDHRWRIFNWVISPNKDLSALRVLSPQHLVVPAAALFYLYHEAQIVTLDEVTTFIIVAVSVKSFSSQQLFKKYFRIPTERAIYLVTLFVRTVLHVLGVAGACGLSFPRPADCHLDAYFDGKLFHRIYSNSQNTTDPKALTEWDESCEDTYSHLMNIIQSGTIS